MKKNNINSSIDIPEEMSHYEEEVVITNSKEKEDDFSPINDDEEDSSPINDDEDEEFAPINDDDDDESHENGNQLFRDFEDFMDSIMSRSIARRKNFSNEGFGNNGSKNGGNSNSNLSRFTNDITEKARRNELDPVTGREKEIQRLTEILCRRKKNNPLLIGEPGVGKSVVLDGRRKINKENRGSEFLYVKKLLSSYLT